MLNNPLRVSKGQALMFAMISGLVAFFLVLFPPFELYRSLLACLAFPFWISLLGYGIAFLVMHFQDKNIIAESRRIPLLEKQETASPETPTTGGRLYVPDASELR